MPIISNLPEHRAFLHPDMIAALGRLETEIAARMPADLRRFLSMADGSILRIVKSYRTPTEQKAEYEAKRSNAQAMQSYHQYGLAVDLVVRKTGYGEYGVTVGNREWRFREKKDYQDAGIAKAIESAGLHWGGDFTGIVAGDMGHVELRVQVPKYAEDVIDSQGVLMPWWNKRGLKMIANPSWAGAMKKPAAFFGLLVASVVGLVLIGAKK